MGVDTIGEVGEGEGGLACEARENFYPIIIIINLKKSTICYHVTSIYYIIMLGIDDKQNCIIYNRAMLLGCII